MTENDATGGVARALADIDRAVKAAVTAIKAQEDPSRAFKLATELTEALRARTNESADLRVQAAAEIYETERLSLAGLADRLAMSKARAAQLIRTSKAAQTTEEPEKI